METPAAQANNIYTILLSVHVLFLLNTAISKLTLSELLVIARPKGITLNHYKWNIHCFYYRNCFGSNEEFIHSEY